MDEDIIKRAQKGDLESFAQAVLSLKDPAYKIAYCYLHNEQNSMDAVCNAVEQAFKNIKKLKDPKLFKTWFIRIVINQCRQYLRKEKRVVYFDKMAEQEARQTNPELQMDMYRILAKLDETDRMMIYMKYYLGYTLEEISESIEVPVGTVKTRIYRNLKWLRKQLEPEEAYI